MNKEYIYHRTGGHYGYITGKNEAELLIRTGKGDFEKVVVCYFDQYLIYEPGSVLGKKEMTLVAETEYYTYYRAKVSPPRNRLAYYFELTNKEGEVVFYNEMGCVNTASPTDLKNFFISYLNEEDAVQTPEWAKDGVCYQIFPDAYSKEDGELDSRTYVDQYELRGGTLKGLISKLDYLQDLGITAIYTTPIFKAHTSHRYETVDYMEIDPRFGTKEEFKYFVEQAHARGIHIILDAVFNHSSSYFHAFEDILVNQEKSIYKDWYYINEWPISREDKPLRYETFASVANMPKLNTHNKEVEAYLLEVVRYWTQEYGIDGWRLDVANEIGLTFWRKFRELVKSINPDALIIGESWNDSNRYLQGDTFDSVMNYPLRTWTFGLLARYASDRTMDQYEINIEKFKNQYNEFLVRYPKPIFDVLMNLMDSHDVCRTRQVFDDERLVHVTTAIQMTLSGFPCIYYGDEVGIGEASVHGEPEDGRQAMWWGEKQDKDILEYHKTLIALRHEHIALRRGQAVFIDMNNQHILAYEKITEEESIKVLINISDEQQEITLTEHEQQLYSSEKSQETMYLKAFEVKIIQL